MLEHHIQKHIVDQLAHTEKLSFSDLKPDNLDNNAFNYHLKNLLRDGFINKIDEGYRLSSEGRRLWRRLQERPEDFSVRAISVLFLAVKNQGKWLLYRRKTHPLLGKVGFMHAYPSHQSSITAAAQDALQKATGLNAEFRVIGSGFFRTYAGEQLESFTNFTMLTADQSSGELLQNGEDAEFFWVSELEPNSDDYLPNMKLLVNAMNDSNSYFYLDEEIITSGS